MKVIMFVFKLIKILFLIITAPIWVPFWLLVKVCKWMDKRGITVTTGSTLR